MRFMNMYFLDLNPSIAVQFLHDRHVLAGIEETAVLLSAAWWNTWTKGIGLTRREHERNYGCKLTEENHPLTLWCAESRGNFSWASRYLNGLILEKKLRFPTMSASPIENFSWRLSEKSPLITKEEMTRPPQLVAASCVKETDFVGAYREYYRHFKTHFYSLDKGKNCANSWTKRAIPYWLFNLETGPKHGKK